MSAATRRARRERERMAEKDLDSETLVPCVAMAEVPGDGYGAIMMELPLSIVEKYAVAKRTPDLRGIALDHCLAFLLERHDG